MDRRNEEIFSHILNFPQVETYWGRDVCRWLTPSGIAAIYFDFRASHCYLLKNNENRDQLQSLIELLSYLDYAVANHIVYVVADNSLPHEDYLFYEGVINLQLSNIPDSYVIGEGRLLRKNLNEMICIVDESSPEEAVLSATDISFLFDKLCYYCFSRVLATKELENFIKHDYLSPQDYYSNKAICVSIISIIIAIFIACISPLLGVAISNKWGETTIKQSQYDKLVDEIKSPNDMIIIQRDTIVLHDTIRIFKRIIKNN